MSTLSLVGLGAALVLAAAIVLAWGKHRRFRAVCREAFTRNYASISPAPKLEMTYSYGYPAFKVSFRNLKQLQDATDAGLNAALVEAIGELCAGRGSKARPFNAEQAVVFVHENILTRADIGLK